MSQIRDAVSVVFCCEESVYMVKRQPYLKAFSGYHAFPGGKVDRNESETPIQHPLFANRKPILMHALIREIQEELGFDLLAAAQAGQVQSVNMLCAVTTPEFHFHRFCNHFYKVNLTQIPVFHHHEDEVAEAEWASPEDLIERFKQGNLLVVPPILRMLEALADDFNCVFTPEADFVYDPEIEVPCLEVVGDLWQLPVLSNTLPPLVHTNAFIVGGYLIDPSPRDSDELEKLLSVMQRFQLEGIFLTHHHPDHHQYAADIARREGLPILLSKDAHQRILALDEGYFDHVEVQEVADGHVLTTWNEKNVVLYAVPGHDEGQMAPAPETMEWMIVGDLIQELGTVVISAPEGNMAKYFRSLEKVIQLNPKIIIPSHGMALGSVYRIQETLNHRITREKQVLTLHQEGRDKGQMLEIIYENLDPHLIPLAMCNIEAHLEKLAGEHRIQTSRP